MVIAFEGRIDVSNTPALKRRLAAALEVEGLTLDLRRASYLDVAAIQLLLAFGRAREEINRPLAVLGPREMLATTLDAVGLSPFLTESGP